MSTRKHANDPRPKSEGASLGRYRLLGELGSGGMGSVFRAWDSVSEREVALKQLHSSKLDAQRLRIEALFEREYYTLARLKHPRIIEVYDYGRSEDGLFYTMELLEGRDLLQRSPLPYRELCRHLCDVASSLALIHAHRLVHRDVSPRNIRFTTEDRAKLIDFGVLAPFGISREVVGTPVCIAPEVIRHMPLDQRSDLYSLGAVAYLGLTGKAPFTVQSVADLSRLRQLPAPPPPSSFAPEIPPELDALVLSMLQADPTARPANAAVVIDQLAAIAGLPAEEHNVGAESYLVSGALVGRESELAWLEARLQRLQAGRGTELLLEGPAGVGRTRLLHELALRAQIKGLCVLRVDAQSAPEAFGVASALGLDLLTANPELAREAAKPYADVLGQLSTEICERLDNPALAKRSSDPAEQRARLQGALFEWFLAVSRTTPIVIAIDNIQAADDASAAFIASLGQETREHGLLIVATQRSGDAVVALDALQVLRHRAGRLKLGGLSPEAYEALVVSLFGAVENTGRVAKLLHDKSRGSPQRGMELVRLLVKNQIVKYGGGAWVLPMEVGSDELPDSDEGLTFVHLTGLSADARALLESLSVLTKPAGIEMCRTLASFLSEAQFHAAFQQLLSEQLLSANAGSYGFTQESTRQSILRAMDDDNRRACCRRAAEALLVAADSGGDTTARIEAGWLLLRAGDEERAAEILAAAGRAYLTTSSGAESGKQALAALLSAFQIYRRNGRSDYQLGRVLFPMVSFAYFEDWRLLLKHSEETLALGVQLSGLSLAKSLKRFLGKRIALVVGLAVAWLRFALRRLGGLDYGLLEAVSSFALAIPGTTGVVATCVNIPRNKRARDLLEPFTYFGEVSLPRLVYDQLTTFIQINSYDSAIIPMLASVRQRFHSPKIKKVLRGSSWKAMYGAVPLLEGLMSAFGFGDAALEKAEELDNLRVRVWAMAADNVRLLYHAVRGESEKMQYFASRVDHFAVQGSTTWQVEMYIPLFIINPYILAGDTIATRKVWEQFSRWAKEVPTLQIYADMAHAAYLSLRGDLAAAIDEFEKLLPAFKLREQANWQSIRNYHAQALNRAGKHARAKEVVLEALSAMNETDHQWAAFYLEAQRQLALAEAGLGNHRQAVALLDGLLAEHGHQDNSMLIGLLHQARAEVTLLMQDPAAFHAQFTAMKERFARTKNPALIAQCERLSGKAKRAGVEVADAAEDSRPALAQLSAQQEMRAALSELQDAVNPSALALQIVMRRTKAHAGYLYLVQESNLRLAVASCPDEPPEGLEERLRTLVERARCEAEERAALKGQDSHAGVQTLAETSVAATTAFVESAPPDDGSTLHEVLVLNAGATHNLPIAGGLILEMDPTNRFDLYPEFLEAVASVLLVRGAANDVVKPSH